MIAAGPTCAPVQENDRAPIPDVGGASGEGQVGLQGVTLRASNVASERAAREWPLPLVGVEQAEAEPTEVLRSRPWAAQRQCHGGRWWGAIGWMSPVRIGGVRPVRRLHPQGLEEALPELKKGLITSIAGLF